MFLGLTKIADPDSSSSDNWIWKQLSKSKNGFHNKEPFESFAIHQCHVSFGISEAALPLPLIRIAFTYFEISNSCPHGYKYQPRALAPNAFATASSSSHILFAFQEPYRSFLLSGSKPTPMPGEDSHGKRAAEEIPKDKMSVGQHIRCMR
jgi:hypothetical protein